MSFFGGSSSSDSSDSTSDSKLDLSESFGNSSTFGSDDWASNSSNTDLQTFVQVETQRQQMMEQCHKLNDVCWKMCVSSVSNSLGSRTETCLTNCTERFVDATLLITQRFAQLASKMQQH